MKRILVSALLMTVSAPVFADRGGNGGENGGITTRSEFLQESVEHSLRTMAAADTDRVSELNVRLTDEETAMVTISADADQWTFTCRLVEETSRGGTVVKKDVVCFQ